MRNWLVVITILALFVAWTAVIFRAVGDLPRTWDYGAKPYIPAQSYYSTEEPPVGRPAPVRQIPPVAAPKGPTQ